jgi:hypothetical protein
VRSHLSECALDLGASGIGRCEMEDEASMARRLLLSIAMVAVLLMGSVSTSIAQNESSFRDLASGSDYRIRVAAALALGKSKDPAARPALEKALADAHPAVRAASAVGLGLIGDAAAIPALQSAAAKEGTPNVKNQMDATANKLASASSSSAKAKFLIALGRLDNRSGVNSAQVVSSFKTTTRSRMAQVPGVEILADGAEPASAGKSRKLPVFMVDGTLIQLAKAQAGADLAYSAKVTYVIRKLPAQELKGTISGTASAAVDARAVKGDSDLAQLQIDAVSAAVDSAFKGAPPALEAAAIK